jgi:hypothetical protein
MSTTLARVAGRSAARGLALLAPVLVLASSASACESCREAIASTHARLAEGFNTSILFMLGMVFIGVPGGFAALVWWSYRSARLRADEGRAFQPDGKQRWSRGPSGRG